PLLENLARDHRVTAYDRPGHGFSIAREWPFTVAANAEVALQLIRALGLHNVAVVGHSFGAMTALALAEQHPEEIRSYVLAGPAPYGITHIDPIYHLLALPYLGPGISRLLAPLLAAPKIRDGLLKSFRPNAAQIPPGFMEQHVRLWSRPMVGVARAKEVINFNSDVAALVPHYHEITAPVLIVVGSAEAHEAEAQRLQGEIPGAKLVVFPDT